MRCIVTGGAGFIGGHLVDRLVNDGHQVFVFDNFTTGGYKNLKATYHDIDLHISPYQSPFPDNISNIDVVFHLAAKARIIPSLQFPHQYIENNVNSTLNMLEWCRLNKVKKFIYSSSSSASHPANPYAYSKLKGEELCALYSDLYGIDCISLRYFNVYGDRMSNIGGYQTVLSIFNNAKISGRPIQIYGDGLQRRDFTFVNDVVDANLIVSALKLPYSTFDVGSGDNFSIIEIARLFNCKIEFLPGRGERLATRANPIPLFKVGWEPKGNVISWIKENLLHEDN